MQASGYDLKAPKTRALILLGVVSFLGLGLSLLALSWFYSRFIFAAEEATPAV